MIRGSNQQGSKYRRKIEEKKSFVKEGEEIRVEILRKSQDFYNLVDTRLDYRMIERKRRISLLVHLSQ